MAKKKSPVTVAGIRAKTSQAAEAEAATPKPSPKPPPSAQDAYSFVADKFKQPDGDSWAWNAATQTFEFLWQVPGDIKKNGTVGTARKYVSNLFFFLGRQVAES